MLTLDMARQLLADYPGHTRDMDEERRAACKAALSLLDHAGVPWSPTPPPPSTLGPAGPIPE